MTREALTSLAIGGYGFGSGLDLQLRSWSPELIKELANQGLDIPTLIKRLSYT